MTPRAPLLLLLGGLLAACAAAPTFDTRGVEAGLTPRLASGLGEQAAGRRVQWGGLIVRARNLEDRTRLEVLAFPLRHNARPKRDAPAQGRFLADFPGYLETADFAPGRVLTLVGTVAAVQRGRVDQAPYTYPVVAADQLYLWPAARGDGIGVHLGVGVIVH